MVRSFSRRDGLFAVVDCSDWDDFRVTMRDTLQTVCGDKAISGRFVFRGQSCSSWDLVSSFDRSHPSLSAADREKRYAELISLFRDNYEAYGGLSGSGEFEFLEDIKNLPQEKLEAIAQHYGLNTRLLDWSFSPYVAAFFSMSHLDQCRTSRVAVWALYKDVFEHFSKAELLFSQDLYRKNVRNLWQMGASTRNLTSTLNMVELFRQKSPSYDHALDADHPRLIRFDIPSICAAQILDDLQLMRINSMTIFPGLDGVVSWLKKRS